MSTSTLQVTRHVGDGVNREGGRDSRSINRIHQTYSIFDGLLIAPAGQGEHEDRQYASGKARRVMARIKTLAAVQAGTRPAESQTANENLPAESQTANENATREENNEDRRPNRPVRRNSTERLSDVRASTAIDPERTRGRVRFADDRGGRESGNLVEPSRQNVTDHNRQPPGTLPRQPAPTRPTDHVRQTFYRPSDRPPQPSNQGGHQSNHSQVYNARPRHTASALHPPSQPSSSPNPRHHPYAPNRPPPSYHRYSHPPAQGATLPLRSTHKRESMNHPMVPPNRPSVPHLTPQYTPFSPAYRPSFPLAQAGCDPAIQNRAHHAPGPSTHAFQPPQTYHRPPVLGPVNPNREMYAPNQPTYIPHDALHQSRTASQPAPGQAIELPHPSQADHPMVKNWQVGNSHARPAHPSILSPTAKTFQLGPLPAHPQPAPWVNPQSYLLHDRREILPTAPAARLGGIEAAPVPHPHFEQAQQGHLVGQPANTSYVPNEGHMTPARLDSLRAALIAQRIINQCKLNFGSVSFSTTPQLGPSPSRLHIPHL
ncbi:hypothetical protein PCANC_04228 [Puccinia coronata f. sp. avenae]|uniref:Uncharacterized protein n=1 Tax=Puccinia coronata f. sp. avenae TaxID=200324 RepID=A0A2N5VX24_9BASI|nr:hypothetical protein PCASD_09711 [Puccinia coronata f. sp. avenae]PLW54545.1 hypothetical protein PCANC_04228 [Puccinia coronata f. sp. avenae]